MQPLITPEADERNGYVPNVVYSCGALRHDELIVVPLGIADCRVGFAGFTIADVLTSMSSTITSTK
jgi:predicted GH43/DUF377 family glycosyl hydrolase